MLLFYGTRTYGKVDQVPGLFYVATTFFYIQFVPLIPTQSYLVFEGSEKDGNFRGCAIPMNGKSVLFAWVRTALLIGGFVLGGLALFEGGKVAEGKGDLFNLIGFILAAPTALFLFWFSYRLAHAGPWRALRIARHAGIPPESLAPYFVHMENLSEALGVEDAVPADPKEG